MVVIIGKGDSVFGRDLSNIKCEKWGLNDAADNFKCDRRISWDNYQRTNDIPFETIVPHGGRWINEGHYLQRKQGYVANFNSSLLLSINIAIQLGYKDIYLLGFDNKIGKMKFYKDFNKQTYENLFNLINKFCKIFEQGLIDEKIYVVDGGIEAFEHISYATFFKRLKSQNFI